MDEERLRQERMDRRSWKSRVTGIEEYAPVGSGDYEPRRRNERNERRPQQHNEEEDLEYKLAIEASKNEMEEEKKRRQSRDTGNVDDEDLAKAIRLSKEEEELRRRELEGSNSNSLFDLDSPASTTQQQPQFTGWNQGYQQQGAVDWFGNPVDQQHQQPQQTQNTGFLNNAYSQGFQSQPAGFQNQQTGFQQQQGGFDPSQFQQQQPNYLQAQQTIQPQQTAFTTSNPYAQQSDFAQFQQQQQPQISSPLAGSQNPWSSQQNNQADALKPMPTGSNNPFASSFAKQQSQQQTQRPGPPSLSTLAEQRTATQFNTNQSSYNPIANYSTPQQTPQRTAQPPREADPTKARLNALLASGEGMDTFGNTGELRIPAQHTAPGTFVNSAGQNLNRLHAAQTGNNPFFGQQFTGAPQSHGMLPAQTGPAGVQSFGGSPFPQASNNPFGGPQRQQTQGGSLIDL